MPSPHPAVTPESIAIARKYGKSVSKGIKAMEECLDDYREYLGGRIGKDCNHVQKKKHCGGNKKNV